MPSKDVIVLADLLGTNKKIAADIRTELERRGILAVNLLSSPGAGKTSLLEQIAVRLRDTAKMAVSPAQARRWAW